MAAVAKQLGRLRTAAFVIVLVSIGAAFAATLTRTPYLIGDGREYVCVAKSWIENGVPYASLEFFDSCSKSIGAGSFVGFKDLNGTVEPFHFWLLSLLAAPLWPAAGLQAFTVLHALLAGAVVWWLFRTLPVGAALLVTAILAASPLVYWADKAHSEFFICALLTAAFASVAKGDLVVASVPVAIAATQQSTLSVPAVLLLAAGLVRSRRNWRTAVIAVAFLALPAAYYMVRIGQPSLLLGMQNWGAIGVHRASSLFVDPDIGLLPSWPVGVLLILLTVAGLAMRRTRPLAGTVVAFCVLEAALVSMQTNWNSGGTITILRYATYFIPPLAVSGAVALFATVERRPRIQAGVAAALLMMLVWYNARWNWPVFHPFQIESYTGRTPFSNWLYTHHPSWYDPDAEVFVERSYYVDGVERVPVDAWAAGNFGCTKLYVLKSLDEMRRMPKPPRNPMHCLLPNDSADVFQALVDGRLKPNARGYINRD